MSEEILKMPCGCEFNNGKAHLCSDKHLKLWEKVLNESGGNQNER